MSFNSVPDEGLTENLPGFGDELMIRETDDDAVSTFNNDGQLSVNVRVYPPNRVFGDRTR